MTSVHNETSELYPRDHAGGTATVGTLTIGGNLATSGTNTATMPLTAGAFAANSFTRLALGNDDVVAINLGGTALVTLPAFPTTRGTNATATLTFDGGTFTVGQTFTLFSGAGAANASNFASILGSPGSGKAFSFTNGVLSVVSAAPSGPALLTNSVSGGVLRLAWPAGQGWRLQSHTNALTVGLGTNWVEAANGSVSSTNITIDSTKPTVFYRLAYP